MECKCQCKLYGERYVNVRLAIYFKNFKVIFIMGFSGNQKKIIINYKYSFMLKVFVKYGVIQVEIGDKFVQILFLEKKVELFLLFYI